MRTKEHNRAISEAMKASPKCKHTETWNKNIGLGVATSQKRPAHYETLTIFTSTNPKSPEEELVELKKEWSELSSTDNQRKLFVKNRIRVIKNLLVTNSEYPIATTSGIQLATINSTQEAAAIGNQEVSKVSKEIASSKIPEAEGPKIVPPIELSTVVVSKKRPDILKMLQPDVASLVVTKWMGFTSIANDHLIACLKELSPVAQRKVLTNILKQQPHPSKSDLNAIYEAIHNDL